MRDGMGRACGLYERWNGHGMSSVQETRNEEKIPIHI